MITGKIWEAPNQIKEVWKVINQQRKSTKPAKENIILTIRGNLIEDQHHISNQFNKYFSEIGNWDENSQTQKRTGQQENGRIDSLLRTNIEHGFRRKTSINSAVNQLCDPIPKLWEDQSKPQTSFCT